MNKRIIDEPKVKVDGLRFSTYLLFAGSIILFIFSIYMWNRFVLTSDKRILWDSIANSLSVDGVRIVADDSEGEKTRRVTLKLDSYGELSSESRSEFVDTGTNSIIRTVSTVEKDYLYYEKNQNAAQPRLSEFEGLWVDIGAEGQTESKTLADQFTNGTLVLVGSLTSSDKKALMSQMQSDEVYSLVGFMGSREIAGTTANVYKVRINSIGFNKALKKYLDSVGLPEAASQIGDTATEGLQPEIELAIDPKSRRIVSTGYPTLDATGAREYYDWDTKYDFELPAQSISADELQKKIDSIYGTTAE